MTVGIGRVVSTSLYPLNQTQPLVRDTEDVIEIAPDRCELTDRFGFEYLGRIRDIVRRRPPRSSDVLCYPILLSEVLGDLPDIAIQPHFRVAALGLSKPFGWQKYKSTDGVDADGKQRLALAIELVWSPRAFPEAAAALAARIREALPERSPALRRAIAEGKVELSIDLREPGSTDLAQLV